MLSQTSRLREGGPDLFQIPEGEKVTISKEEAEQQLISLMEVLENTQKVLLLAEETLLKKNDMIVVGANIVVDVLNCRCVQDIKAGKMCKHHVRAHNYVRKVQYDAAISNIGKKAPPNKPVDGKLN